jgi:hypothetical protein
MTGKAHLQQPCAHDRRQKESRVQHFGQRRQSALSGLKDESRLSYRIRCGIKARLFPRLLPEHTDQPSGVDEVKHPGGKFAVERCNSAARGFKARRQNGVRELDEHKAKRDAQRHLP